MVEALLRDPSREFWSEVRKSYRKKSPSSAPIAAKVIQALLTPMMLIFC